MAWNPERRMLDIRAKEAGLRRIGRCTWKAAEVDGGIGRKFVASEAGIGRRQRCVVDLDDHPITGGYIATAAIVDRIDPCQMSIDPHDRLMQQVPRGQGALIPERNERPCDLRVFQPADCGGLMGQWDRFNGRGGVVCCAAAAKQERQTEADEFHE